MTEKQYRIQRLKEINAVLKNKRIALYGTGKNAEAILDGLESIEIIALIDKAGVGKYKYGKKIISLEEALYLELDVIIIAAEVQSEKKIVARIVDICRQNNIALLNMYGIDILKAKKRDILQDISYKDLSRQNIITQIEQSEVICFELMGGLCESRFYSDEIMWKKMEIKYGVSDFFENRCLAEAQRNKFRPYDIDEIYNRYLANTFLGAEEVKKLREQEENCFANSIVPKTDMVELLQETVKKGKTVFIISDLSYTYKTLCHIFSTLSIPSNVQLVQENIVSRTFSGGALRIALDKEFGKKTLYIGRKDSLGYYVAGVYGMDCQMIKSSWEFMRDLSEFTIETESLTDKKAQDYKEWGIKEYNSPFLSEKRNAGENFPQIEQDSNKTFTGRTISLLEPIGSDKEEDFEHLSFPQNEEIAVSIVIPVYNHFDYTYMCLKSILLNTIKVNYEIIIADDCSTDMTVQIENIVDGVRVVRNNENMFFLKNCNNASQYARGKYILFLNNDTQVRYNWLYPLVYLLDQDERIGLAGSKLIFPDGKIQEAGGIVWSDGSAANYGRNKDCSLPEFNYVKEVDYISGASIIIRKKLWEEIGGFDERFAPAYYEDTDLAFQVRKRGMKVVYQPASVVVHFEGISNGQDVQEGIKKYQIINQSKFAEKWKKELLAQKRGVTNEIFAARERKQNRKTVLFISVMVPTYDRDAGSKSILNYMKLFLKKGYIVKFLPLNFYNTEPYTFELQQIGVEVLYGSQMKAKLNTWLIGNQKDIEYAFINYPDCAYGIIDLLKLTTIKVRYYGHDLHFLRLKRGYEISGDESSLRESQIYLKKEKAIIEKAECVYYPSEVEIDIVKKKFKKTHAKQISLYMYDKIGQEEYSCAEREGLMFIGGSHAPNEDAVIWFLKEIYPSVYNETKAPFYLIGSGQSLKLRQIKSEGVVNLGYVTEEKLADLYHKVRIVVIPLRFGAGIKGKVVDALYHGVPVVSTSIGIEGIPEAEEIIGSSNTAEEFQNRVIELYGNPQALKALSKGGRKIIKEYFSADVAWEKIKGDF